MGLVFEKLKTVRLVFCLSWIGQKLQNWSETSEMSCEPMIFLWNTFNQNMRNRVVSIRRFVRECIRGKGGFCYLVSYTIMLSFSQSLRLMRSTACNALESDAYTREAYNDAWTRIGLDRLEARPSRPIWTYLHSCTRDAQYGVVSLFIWEHCSKLTAKWHLKYLATRGPGKYTVKLLK